MLDLSGNTANDNLGLRPAINLICSNFIAGEKGQPAGATGAKAAQKQEEGRGSGRSRNTLHTANCRLPTGFKEGLVAQVVRALH